MITDEMVEAGLRAWYPPDVWDDTVRSGDPIVPQERKDMRLALEAAEAAAWRPIESAPKDGTFVLLSGFVVAPRGWSVVGRHNANGVFVDGKSSTISPNPTHWRPLPVPPRDRSGG